MDTKPQKPALNAKLLLRRLHDPLQLRMILTGCLVLFGYGGVYLPLSNDIAETQAKLSFARKRLNLTKDIEALRTEFNRCKPRLSEKPDPNEWIQYVLGGIRQLPLTMLTMDFRPTREVGPYKAIVLRIELEGSFQDLHTFLCWLENNERLFRVDGVTIAPPQKGQENLVMELNLLGMMG